MSKKAQERLYFKTRELVEQYKAMHPGAVLSRFIKDASDLNRTEWIGYSVTEEEAQANSNQTDSQVPEVA